MKYILIILIVVSVLCSCRKSDESPILFDRIDAMCDSDPQQAIEVLDGLHAVGLSEDDRHHYDLLSIKAGDKAYVRHTSDSLILDVIDYYSRNSVGDLYPEALYYGGRVYSDMGDLPTALRYFQNALDHTQDSDNLRLRSNILSQTGRLMHELRLYSQAVPYIEESIKISKELKDTFGIAYDNRLLCVLYTNEGNYEKAKAYNSEASRYAQALSNGDAAEMVSDLASIYYAEGKTDSALMEVRPFIDMVDPLSRNYALSVAAEIYLAAGVCDTAYMYAMELARSSDSNNKNTGFKIIFSPEMRGFVPYDTLLHYIPTYARVVQDYLDEHEAREALEQNTTYNYRTHERARYKAEKQNQRITVILLFSIIVIIGLVAAVLYLLFHNARERERLHGQLEIVSGINRGANDGPCSTRQELKKRLHKELSFFILNAKMPEVSKALLQSETYTYLINLINNQKMIRDDEWERIERTVEDNSIQFKQKLLILTDNGLSEMDYQVAILIRFGFSTTQMAILLNRTKGAVSTRRSDLAKKIFNTSAMINELDKFILKL